jgi:isochorismate synthase EntC
VRELVSALRAADVALEAVPEPTVLPLGTVQHLYTPLAGRDGSGNVLDLLERLHPTPAVGGCPSAEALTWLRHHEGLDRGWYAAPVGWLDASGDGEFAVAIRSALLHPAGASLFAGCGLVADSDPEAEYAESWLKLRPMLAALDEG